MSRLIDLPQIIRLQLEVVGKKALSGRPTALPELTGGARPLVIRLLAAQTEAPVLVVAPTEALAAELAEEIAYYSGQSDREAVFFPAYDVSPYESISPGHKLIHKRLDALHRLLREPQRIILIASAEALSHRIAPVDVLAANHLELAVGDEVDRDELSRKLVSWGYTSVSLTEDVGDFSVRGSLVDLFPPTAGHPVRLDLLGDTIEQMRTFHPENQRTREVIERTVVLPCREIILSQENTDRFSNTIKELADSLSLLKKKRDPLVADAVAGIYFPGIEFLLPLFYDRADTVLDALPEGSLVILDEWVEIARRAEAFFDKVQTRHRRCIELHKIAVEPKRRYLSDVDLVAELSRFSRIYLGLPDPLADPEPEKLPVSAQPVNELRERIAAQDVSARMLEPVAERIRRFTKDEQGKAVIICSGRAGLERMRMLLGDYGLRLEIFEGDFQEILATSLHATGTVSLIEGRIRRGFDWPEMGLLVLTEEDLFGEKKRRTPRPRPKASQVISSFGDLQANDFVVHNLHGIGIYRGLTSLEAGGVPGEFLLIEYAGGDKLYLPVDRLSLVQRYSGGEGATPQIDKLGSGSWEKTKARAKVGARKMAKELLALYAARQAQEGFGFELPETMMREMEATFPYEETPDQAETIAEVLNDMQGLRPMDRLVCGDVGFGKTEVALRAAFLCAANGKQVAVLVPTTTLAFQHLRTFRERLSAFGVSVGMLSRFVTPEQRKKVLTGLIDGSVDVVIGTHQLLSKKIKIRDLGLLVIDEEQHFGVAQKEKIKQLRQLVDVLTLTATPIPRTFNMSLVGIRDMSIINTPPEDRLAIRTLVTRFDEDTIREALSREFARGGQAFFIHNRVKTIDSLAERIGRLVPEAKMAVGHGQMDKQRLEKIMIDFSSQKINLLISTSIIESGLDFPLANTILIDRADTFGLAQLYQLRGRVGRSERRAYAYLLIPHQRAITPDARKRLAVLKNFSTLGSGFKIAAHDLEIRGAGNLLGAEQSGHIFAVGFELYHKLLEEAVAELRGQKIQELFETEVNLRLPAYIPATYIPDEQVRLTFYKRLAGCENQQAADQLKEELTDRFGELPEAVENLLRVLEIKRLASALRIRTLDLGADGVVLKFDDQTPVAPARIISLVHENPAGYQLFPDGRLLVSLPETSKADLVDSVKKLLHELD